MFNRPFLMEGVGFFIKDQVPNFNPKQDSIKEILILVRLYNLLYEYWHEETLKALDDKLGKFIKFDETIEKENFNMYT